MFQTDIHHFLQSFATDELTFFMKFITDLGYALFFMIFLVFLTFVIDFKKGFLMLLILLWTGCLTYLLKESFQLPRPFHVDNTVQLLDGDLPDNNTLIFEKRGATTFWGSLPTEVVEHISQNKETEFGFPSGHTSIAIAFWAALALLFRKRWLSILSVSLMILIPFSRIYLGVHFIADVLGGIVVGLAMLWLFYKIVIQPDKLETFLARSTYPLGANLLTLVLVGLPLIWAVLLPPKTIILYANLWAYGVAFLVLAQQGLPSDEGLWWQRVLRFLAALGLFGLTSIVLKQIVVAFDVEQNTIVTFFRYSIGAFVLVWGGVAANLKMGLMKRQKMV